MKMRDIETRNLLLVILGTTITATAATYLNIITIQQMLTLDILFMGILTILTIILMYKTCQLRPP